MQRKYFLLEYPPVEVPKFAWHKKSGGGGNSYIIATTVDEKGLELTRSIIAKTKYKDQIICKLEDCSKSWSAEDNSLDYVYARLVFHYLTKGELDFALKEMYRTLKRGEKAFIVVRSIDEPELKASKLYEYDEKSGFITSIDFGGEVRSRQFFSEKSLRDVLQKHGFKVEYTKIVHEHLYQDFARTIKNPNENILIECVVNKVNKILDIAD